MRHLLNTLFVTSEDAYASLDGENIVLKQDEKTLGRFPLHILEGIFLFTYAGASPALMGKCAKENINLVFMSPNGKFLARTVGESHGNVLLRRIQYRTADDSSACVTIARNMIFAKVSNARHVLNRTRRDHAVRVDEEKFLTVNEQLLNILSQILEENVLESVRGYEGVSASLYFSLFDDMILRNKEDFKFKERSRRPPLDNVNALLSFVYMILANECAAALEMVGLDSFVGFMHKDRAGRKSLALDLMEELRPCMADRFCISMINERKILKGDFVYQENGAVYLSDTGRKKVQKEWQMKKQEKITHPYLKEKIEWGLVPYVQALLLTRYLRGDIDGYPPFIWK